MNERIKELLGKAGFDVKRLLEPYPGGFPREDMLALESFAELIVRECIELNRQELSFAAFSRMMEKYDQHFGIKLFKIE